MQLESNFTVPAGIDEAWRAFNDPETVAPCFPGATLDSMEGDSFTGTVKVKLGPISLTYRGKGTFVERDEANHKVVIDAQGRDSRGNGTASAVVTGTLTPAGDALTAVKMITDMTITGRPAQFGRGVISDVSDRIVTQFSSALAERLSQSGAGSGRSAGAGGPGGSGGSGGSPAAQPGGSVGSPAGSASAGRASAASTSLSAGSSAGVPPVPAQAMTNGAASSRSSDVEAIDLLDAAAAPVLRRLVPVLSGLSAVLIVFLLRRRRRRARSVAPTP